MTKEVDSVKRFMGDQYDAFIKRANDELFQMLHEYISLEIDLEILKMLADGTYQEPVKFVDDPTAPNILGVYFYTDKNGVKQYRVRGMGKKYSTFFDWLDNSSARDTGNDMPWCYFVFDTPTDHDEMCKLFSGDVFEDDPIEDEDND